jgi:hypothetical protein
MGASDRSPKPLLLVHAQLNSVTSEQLLRMPNVALERLAHATTNNGYSPASPLQALVVRLLPVANAFPAMIL